MAPAPTRRPPKSWTAVRRLTDETVDEDWLVNIAVRIILATENPNNGAPNT